MLIIDSTDGNFINQAQNDLNTLAGMTPQAFEYTQVMGIAYGQWIQVSKGTGFNAALIARPRGAGLVAAVIDSAYVARIVMGQAGNGASPERTSPLHAPSLDLLRTQANIQQRSVNEAGSSCVINWTGQPETTANLNGLQLGGANSHIILSPCPSYICLAHELIHADRCARGIVDGRRTDQLYFLIDSRPGKDLTAWAKNAGKTVYQDQGTGYWYEKGSELMEEIFTVGMPYANGAQLPTANHLPPHPLGITENDIRGENNIGIRLKYGNYHEGNNTSGRYIGNQ